MVPAVGAKPSGLSLDQLVVVGADSDAHESEPGVASRALYPVSFVRGLVPLALATDVFVGFASMAAYHTLNWNGTSLCHVPRVEDVCCADTGHLCV